MVLDSSLSYDKLHSQLSRVGGMLATLSTSENNIKGYGMTH